LKKAATIFAATALAAFGIAACGSSDDDSDTTAADTTTAPATTDTTGGAGLASLAITAAADGSFAFDEKSLDAKAGPVEVNFSNPASLSHDVVITDSKGTEVGKTDLISKSKASFTADLKPGTYTFFCDVPGHEEGGMKGTLTVK
jgi:plastocyanin